jgi:hypothetical protein
MRKVIQIGRNFCRYNQVHNNFVPLIEFKTKKAGNRLAGLAPEINNQNLKFCNFFIYRQKNYKSF